MLFAAIAWLVLTSLSPLPPYLLYQLEKSYAVFEPENHNINDSLTLILIMGGGHTNAQGLTAAERLSETAKARLMEAIRIGRQIKGSKLVCSGFSSSGRITQAQMLADAAVDLGWSAQDTLQQRAPRNTKEEIIFFKKRFGGKIKPVVVTSAAHMPRVMHWCRVEGMEVFPAPADFLVPLDTLTSSFNFKPDERKIRMTHMLLVEYAAMLKAKLSMNE